MSGLIAFVLTLLGLLGGGAGGFSLYRLHTKLADVQAKLAALTGAGEMNLADVGELLKRLDGINLPTKEAKADMVTAALKGVFPPGSVLPFPSGPNESPKK